MIKIRPQYRFFLHQERWFNHEVEIKTAGVAHQILNVLRLKKGDQLLALDNQGFQYQAEIFKEKPLLLKLLSKDLNRNEPTQKIVLFQSLIKKDKFEWVLQKGTEVGVSEFVPVLAARSEKIGLVRDDRMEAILREAAEQSRRGKIPKLRPPQSFNDLKGAASGALSLLLEPQSSIPLARYFPAIPGYSQINILIGPEGGFTSEELEQAKKNGWEAVNVGPRILRTETAGVLAAGAILIATQS